MLAVTPLDFGIGQLFWHIRDAVVVADAQTERILLWNPAAEAIFGYSAEEIVGAPIETLVPDEYRERHRQGLARFRAGQGGAVLNAPTPVELPALRKDGQRITVELSLTQLRNTAAEGQFVLALLRDVSDRKRWTSAVDELTNTVSASTGQAFFDRLASFLARTLRVDAVLVGELAGERQDRVRTISYLVRGNLLEGITYRLSGTPCENVAGQGFCAIPSGVQARFPEDRDLVQLGFDGYVGIPIFGGDGRPLGLIAGMHSAPIPDVEFARALLTLVASRAAAELERKQADQLLVDRARRAALQADVNRAISQQRELGTQLQACAEALVTHLDAAFARIWTLDEQESVLELRASAGLYTHLDGGHSRVSVGKLKIGLIAQEREPHLTNDLQDDPRVGDKEWARREGLVAFAGYPLVVEKRLVGVVAMFARHPLSEAIVQDLETAATSIAQCIERKRAESQRENLLAQLTRERTLLESVLKQMPSGVAIIEAPSGEVILTNAQLESIYQAPFAPPARVNQDAGYQLTREDGSAIPIEDLPLVRALRHGESVQEAEMVVVRADGTRRIIKASSAPIRSPDGHIVAAAGTYNDVSDQKAAEAALAQRAAELARSNEELERFAYVASHDLQEPLRVVVSYLQLLERRYKGQLDERADKYIGHAVEGGKRMQRLINDLLAYSRVGRMGREFAPTDLSLVVERASANLQAAIDESDAVVTWDPLPTLSVDASQMGQLFQNLIGNALKFRAEDPPRVHISAERQDKEWRFSIRDNGIGIDQNYNDRIFVIFQRLHSRDEYPGTGIGLAICKKIVDRHGGTIWVEPNQDRGSTFYFTIPDNGGSPA